MTLKELIQWLEKYKMDSKIQIASLDGTSDTFHWAIEDVYDDCGGRLTIIRIKEITE